MSLLGRVAQRISDHPVLSLFVRSLLENDFRTIRAVIRRELRTGPGVRTLDVGCGPGAFADLFRGGDYVGVDLNPRFIDHARRHRPGTFVVGDARRLELPDGRFDQVLVFGLLRHLPDDAVRAVLAECRRVLAPGGRILAIEDVPAASRGGLPRRWVHRLERVAHVRPVHAYRRLFEECGRVEREEVLKSGYHDYYAARLAV